MSYRSPIIRPAVQADAEMPPLRGQAALRIAGIVEFTRDGPARERACDLSLDHALTAVPAPVCGLDLARPRIMGILNVTPDSFSDGGRFHRPEAALDQARAMVAQGADILDIGGESTRPGADEVSVADEIARTVPLIAALRAEGVRVPLSIDTRKAAVAEAALSAGADFVNDVSALTWDRDLARVIAGAGVPVCLMHAQGTPQTMQIDPQYKDVRLDVLDWLAQARERALAAGIAPERIVLDPGIGFGKTVGHNLALLNALAFLHDTGCAILVGASRKRFVGVLSGVAEAGARLAGSLAVALHAAAQGAQILRVHDVGQTRQALALWQALSERHEDEQA